MRSEADEKYMRLALQQAQKAYDAGETPIGSVIVHDDKVIAQAANARDTQKNVLAHAEILAISQACAHLGDWRLEGCTLYVTLEPCPMCAGAIVQARIPRVVYGAKSPKAGAAGSIINILQQPKLNHQCEITQGICEKEAAQLMSDFFAHYIR